MARKKNAAAAPANTEGSYAVLCLCDLHVGTTPYKAGTVLEIGRQEAADLEAQGLVDPHEDAVAHAVSHGAVIARHAKE